MRSEGPPSDAGGVRSGRYRVRRQSRTPAGFAVAEIGYPPHRRQAPHAHPGASVTLVLRGAVRERAGALEEIGRSLSVVVKPVGVEHADEYGRDGLDTLQIAVPDPLADLGADAGAGPGWRWIHAGPVTAPFLEVLRVLREHPGDGARLEWAVLDTLAALTDDAGRDRGDPPGWLARVRERIDDAAPGSLSVEAVAAEAGVHPVSLTRAFRRHYGVTTSGYLQRVRIRRAARLLADSPRPLSSVAYASGFSDQSHMTRETRAATGVTPARLRALIATPRPDAILPAAGRPTPGRSAHA